MGNKEKRTYSVKLTCSNCGHEWTESYPYGETVPIIEKCPICGCYRGRKIL